MSNNMKYIINPDTDYLEHAGKGEQWKEHLYTARNWVNGKWQYVYGNAANAAKNATNAVKSVPGKLNNALGADEREERNRTRTDAGHTGSNTAAAGKAAQAQSKYDKTVYGKIERGKNAISRIFNKIGRGASNAAGKVGTGVKNTTDKIGNALEEARRKREAQRLHKKGTKYLKKTGSSGFKSESEYRDFINRNKK